MQRQMNKSRKGRKSGGNEIGADVLLRLPMKEMPCRIQLMRTRQSENLAVETTADRDVRLQQMSARQCERLAAETTIYVQFTHIYVSSQITTESRKIMLVYLFLTVSYIHSTICYTYH